MIVSSSMSSLFAQLSIVFLFLIIGGFLIYYYYYIYSKRLAYQRPNEKNTPLSLVEAPNLGKSHSETLAASAFERVLQDRGHDHKLLIRNYRPTWLTNPSTGRAMEIDAYYPPLRLGIEYNGAQHYIFPNKFHPNTKKGREEFDLTVFRDQLKRKLAEEQNVKIITIPYYVDTCVRCQEDPTGYRYRKTSNKEKWEKLRLFIDRNF